MSEYESNGVVREEDVKKVYQKKVVTETGQKIIRLTSNQYQSLRDYQSAPNVNLYLFKKASGKTEHIPSPLKEKMEKDIESIDSIFTDSQPIQKPVTVYRATLQEEPSPDEFTNTTYTGTFLRPDETLEETVNVVKDRKVIQEIRLKPGQQAVYLPAYLHFDPYGEKELLLPRDTKFHVIERDQIDNKIVEKVEVVE